MTKGLRLVVLAGLASCVVAAPAQGYVYWSIQGGAIGRADEDGSAVNHSFLSDSNVGGVAIDGSHIYWTNPTTNSIGRANLDGSAASPTFITNATTSPSHPGYLAVDGSHIYWTDGARYVGRANLDGTGVNPQWADDGAGNDPNGIAVDQGNVYFIDLNHFQVIPSGNTTPQSVTSLPANTVLLGITASGGYIYYTAVNEVGSPPRGLIGRVQISSGATPDNTFITGLGGPGGVTVDGSEIYWTDTFANTIGRAPLSSPSSAQDNWISEPAEPLDIKVDDNVDPTQTSVSCSPSSVTPGTATACTATVGDSASSSPPTGTVSFSSNASTFFSGSGSSCTLSAQPGDRQCTVGVVAIDAGTIPINASYGGDSLHQPSMGSTTFCAGTSSQCGGGGGGGFGAGGAGGITGTTAQTPTKPQLHSKINRKKHTAKFTFTANGATGFQCALVERKRGHKKQPKPHFSACPSSKTYKHVKGGSYTFEVRGTNKAGTGPAATFKFMI